MGGEYFLDGFRLFFTTSGPTKRREHYFCLLFSQYWVGVEQQSMFSALLQEIFPGLFYLEPHRKVNATTLELFTTNFKNLKQNDQPVFKP